MSHRRTPPDLRCRRLRSTGEGTKNCGTPRSIAAHSLDAIFPLGYNQCVVDVLFTGEFETWWDGLAMEEQISINAIVILLESQGVNLGYPHSSKIVGSRHSQMRELRIQHAGRPY